MCPADEYLGDDCSDLCDFDFHTTLVPASVCLCSDNAHLIYSS